MTKADARMTWLSTILLLILIASVAVIALAFNRLFEAKVYLATLVVAFGVMEKVFSRVVKSYAPGYLLPEDQYPGDKWEDRANRRNRHVAMLEEISFWSLLVLLSGLAFIKALSGGE